MKPQHEDTRTLSDFSGFKWISFLQGGTLVDDLSVMEISNSQARFSKSIIHEQYFSPSYCFQFVVSGSLFVTINNQDYEIKANEGCLITPGFLVHKHDDTDNIVDMFVVSISRSFMQEINPQFPLAYISQIYVHPVWKMSVQKTQTVLQYIELLREVIEEKDRTAAIHLMRSLLHYLAGEDLLKSATPMSRNEEITGRFMHLVDANCNQHHNLDWYAEQLCLSTRYVANTIKETLGMTASACIEQALMQRAKTLLYTTNKPIQKIADELGFLNQSHFGTFFKRHEGVSPATFRKSPKDKI